MIAMNSKATALYELTNALQPVRRVWKQAVSLVIANTDISMSLATVVVLVQRNPQGITQKELAEEAGINPGALVRLLDQAAQAQLLERREMQGDRRAKTLHILPQGEVLASQVSDAANKLRLELMKDVPQEDIEHATKILRLFEERATQYQQRNKGAR
ncbi:MarR family winged helix-turn-helix transcriptional regulator [Aeromonas dhakensis]|uniref:MarR family winged helix-turn-helix transcriptional regulator n=1 Tax=Aeromonas dhakensis TaxID=196024 RepID=UPI001980C911|nr:MarR family transcriptional regulator [Aeromonas dhakensis]